MIRSGSDTLDGSDASSMIPPADYEIAGLRSLVSTTFSASDEATAGESFLPDHQTWRERLDQGSLAMLMECEESETEIHRRMPGVFMRIPEVSAWKMKYSRCQLRAP